ncbi:hypothetical protein O0I10_001720 [Lichtheimia ornata]|uniref:Uncharacterized protein n=1 Tax=Lichtheimia ornata TaxID=688661 RepID=A0AAD7VDH1_9FUNG|nr:uncharacterized protein O0I10_001720 [Lichtheimia ornata]KAJ8662756.1 hypothetical protein O0I10_001720 [Lichtheimia ornata]
MAQPLAPPSPPTTTTSTGHHTTHKKHNRHHVKRRSAGRVHVTKLAPMARANTSHTDTEADIEHHDNNNGNHKRPHMRRSQSQRSLNRLSNGERKGGGGLTALAPIHPSKTSSTVAAAAATTSSPPTTPSPPPSATENDEEEEQKPSRPKKQQQPQQQRSKQDEKGQSSTIAPRKDSPAFFVSSQAPAAPIEQTFNAVAKNLVSSNNTSSHTSLPSIQPSSNHRSSQPLRSQFIDETIDIHHHHPKQRTPVSSTATATTTTADANGKRLSNVAAAANAQPPGMSRTQQKLLLQRQHCLVDDENNLGHPKNMRRLTRELERVGREYQCVRRYHDPMMESLQRCLEQQQQQQQQPRMRLSQRTRSSAVLPTFTESAATTTTAHLEPHYEQRQAIHRRHLQLKMMAQQGHSHYHPVDPPPSPTQSAATGTLNIIRWSAGVLLDRVWNGSSSSYS